MKKYVMAYFKERYRLLLLCICLLIFVISFFALQYDNGVEGYPLIIGVLLICIVVSIDAIFYVYRLIKLSQYYDLEYIEMGLPNALIQEYHTIQHKHLEEKLVLQQKYKEEQRFLSQWVHNMKTPISVMELCMEEKNDPKNMKVSIEEELHRLNQMLNMTLQYIRIDDFKEDFVPERMDLQASIKSCINEHRNTFIYNHCFPVFKSCEQDIFVLTDAKWHDFMLHQIINNAIKYSCQKEESKVIFQIVSGKGRIRLLVKDEGIGIPSKDLGRVFDPFFTGDNGRIVKSSTGIGLYITKRVADALGHKIEIDSKVGEGTTVILTYLTEL